MPSPGVRFPRGSLLPGGVGKRRRHTKAASSRRLGRRVGEPAGSGLRRGRRAVRAGLQRDVDLLPANDLNGGLTIWGILPTLYNVTKAHHKEVLEALRFKYGSEVYKEPSRETTKYNDATVLKTDVSALDKALGAYWDRLAATLAEGRKVT